MAAFQRAKTTFLAIFRLSRMLSPYKIMSKDVWIKGESRKGYEIGQFAEEWERYLPFQPTQEGEDARAQVTQGSPLDSATRAHEQDARRKPLSDKESRVLAFPNGVQDEDEYLPPERGAIP